ncbi:hypothetical protein ABH992_005439 [Bradyrhizobium yuanmingense]|uniref:FAD-binding protein n=1 Tax=Bradyrhizobium yuanmingense TaxID=108015 RepID=A0ABV4GM69_9BRAD
MRRPPRNSCSQIAERTRSKVGDLLGAGTISAIVGVEGGRGSAVFGEVVSELPYGFPKLLVSSARPALLAKLATHSDIILYPALVDLFGLNVFTTRLLENVERAIAATHYAPAKLGRNKKIVAITADQLLHFTCEKSPRLGGTTAFSNGMVWVPCSAQARAANIDDTIADARTYLQHELGVYYRAQFIDAYLEDSPSALTALENGTSVKFTLAITPDYHSSQLGGADKGRALSPAPYDGRLLGKDFDLIGHPIRVVLGGMMISSSEVKSFLNPLQSVASLKHVLTCLSRYARDRLSFSRGTELSGGNALIARLLVSLREYGVEIWPYSPAVELTKEGWRVTGAIIKRINVGIRVRASRGVVLATGGFARNAQLRTDLSGAHQHDVTLAHADVNGDRIGLATTLGAAIDKDVASAGFWSPVSILKRGSGSQVVPYGWLDRGRPGVIAVGPNARRFVNESNSYHDICLAVFENGYPADKRFYFICDHQFVRLRGMGHLLPWPWTLSIGEYVRLGYVKAGETISELAKQLGLDPAVLQKTTEEHNGHAAQGRDPSLSVGNRLSIARSAIRSSGKIQILDQSKTDHLSRCRSFRQRSARRPDWRRTVTETSWMHKATQSRVFMLAATT